MDQDRSIPCNCWCNLDYCPVNCEEKRGYLHKVTIDQRFCPKVFNDADIHTSEEAKKMFVNFEEL